MSQVAKYMIKKDWKEFSLNLGMVQAELVGLTGSHLCGLQAHSHLEIWFTEEPTEEQKSMIDLYWDGLTETSAEAVGYYSQEELQNAVQAARLDAVTKTFDELSVAQKKIIMGVSPTAEELGIV